MADLFYSDEALNVKSAFYRAKVMVFVEGNDDILFWHEVFSQVPEASVEVESVGGSDQIDRYIRKILSGELQAIATRDSDFLPHMTGIINDPRVLYSFGYAIENSLYTAESIAVLTSQWCRTPKILIQDSTDWLADLAATLRPLIHLDLANRMSNGGACTVTDKCTQLMKPQNPCEPCKSKVANQVTHARAMVPAYSQTLAEKKLGNRPEDLMRWLRGHFLASAVLKYVLSKANGLGKKINLSSDSLYAAAIGHFGHVLGVSHPHQDYYIQTASAAYKAIR